MPGRNTPSQIPVDRPDNIPSTNDMNVRRLELQMLDATIARLPDGPAKEELILDRNAIRQQIDNSDNQMRDTAVQQRNMHRDSDFQGFYDEIKRDFPNKTDQEIRNSFDQAWNDQLRNENNPSARAPRNLDEIADSIYDDLSNGETPTRPDDWGPDAGPIPDVNGDGLPDWIDDADFDGIPDDTDDSDRDGVFDSSDDSDDDGVLDIDEDSDGDGNPDINDDSDSDGIPDDDDDTDDDGDGLPDPGPGGPGPDAPGWPPTPPTPPRDPLVLDLGGDGVQLISVRNSTASFDFDGDGFRERTGWVAPDDAILVRDSNGNGIVDGANELFGDATIDGFTALATIDSNLDGRINAADAAFGQLLVWRDLNSDGLSTSNELQTLTSAGIVELGLERIATNQVIAGNPAPFVGTFTRTDGSQSGTAAVFFQTNRTLTEWVAPPGFVINEEALLLPRLNGYGQLADLQYAMTLDTSLRSTVKAFMLNSGGMTGAELRSGFNEILYAWAGVGGSVDGSRGVFVDARRAAFLEIFSGSPVAQTPDARFGAVLNAQFESVAGVMLLRALSSAGFVSLLAGTAEQQAASSVYGGLAFLRFYEDGIDAFSGTSAAAIYRVVDSAPRDARAAMDYFDKTITALAGLKLEYFEGSEGRFIAAIGHRVANFADVALKEYVLELAKIGPVTFGAAVDATIDGGAKSDIVWGQQGNDTMNGGLGDDSYVYLRGDGNDIIEDTGGQDKLLLVGIKSTDATMQLIAGTSDLKIIISGVNGGDIIVKNFFSVAGAVELLVFADGVRLGAGAIERSLGIFDTVKEGTSSDDNINGTNKDDLIDGGAGNDSLDGGASGDTYIFASGDGNDTIHESNGSTADIDVLQLSNLNAADIC
jgi:hypothetical protein